jgi:glyoxylate reductase
MDLDRLLAESDFVRLHVPLLPATRHLISTSQFARMKRSAFLINTSRGPVVDEAALDVNENEPRLTAGPVGRKNVVLTPHIASASLETRTKMAAIAAENATTLFSGRRLPNPLNPEVVEKSQSPF